MKRSVIICTYQAPRELDFALCALARQSLMPDEVMVADDGSDEGTQAVVEEWRSRVPFRLDHCWQVDRGYRKARIVNEAVRRSTGEHLLFLDGDSFPHPHWVADHAAAYRPDVLSAGAGSSWSLTFPAGSPVTMWPRASSTA